LMALGRAEAWRDRDRCGVDEDVDVIDFLADALRASLDRFHPGRVHLHGLEVVPKALGRDLVAGDGVDMRALLAEALDDHPADIASGAGDDSGLVREVGECTAGLYLFHRVPSLRGLGCLGRIRCGPGSSDVSRDKPENV